MNRQIEARGNPAATPDASVCHASQTKIRRVAGIAINVLGAFVLFSESLRVLNAGL